jgi:hypothetical protein
MATAFDLLLELKEKINNMEQDFIKAIDKRNKTAGIRARRLLMEISDDCRKVRQQMLEDQNDGLY